MISYMLHVHVKLKQAVCMQAMFPVNSCIWRGWTGGRTDRHTVKLPLGRNHFPCSIRVLCHRGNAMYSSKASIKLEQMPDLNFGTCYSAMCFPILVVYFQVLSRTTICLTETKKYLPSSSLYVWVIKSWLCVFI